MDNSLNFDPRPDLSDDSWLWDWLLKRLTGEDQGLFHAFRCAGFRLNSRDGRAVLEPTILPALGFATQAEYQEFKERWMVPNREIILSTLQKVELTVKNDQISKMSPR